MRNRFTGGGGVYELYSGPPLCDDEDMLALKNEQLLIALGAPWCGDRTAPQVFLYVAETLMQTWRL